MSNTIAILFLLLALAVDAQPTNWNYAAADMMARDYSNALINARANVLALSTAAPMIDLAWDLPTNNYTNGMPTNWAAVISSSTNLLTPRSNWTVEFTGVLCTNCELPMTTPAKFYCASAKLL